MTTHRAEKAHLAPLTTAALALLTLVPLAVLGVFVRWPAWAIATFSVSATAAVLLAAWYIRPQRFGGPPAAVHTRIITPAVALVALVVACACLAVTLTQWTIPDRTRTADKDAITTVASGVAQKVATLTAGNTEQYLTDLKPYVTPQVAAVLKTKIIDRLPPHTPDHQANVRAVSIERMNPGAASVVAVIDRRIITPGAQNQPATDQIALWLIFEKTDGRWLVQNLGLAT